MAKVFFIGDSITVGAWDTSGGWVSRITEDILALTITALEKKEKFYCLPYNLGISGDTVPDVTIRIKHEIQSRLDKGDEDEPIQIILSIGVNDSVLLVKEGHPKFTKEEFQKNLEALIKVSLSITKNVSFIGLLPVDDKILNPIPWAPDLAYNCKSIEVFEHIIQTICQRENIKFLPMFKRCKDIQNFNEWLLDGIHPNSIGHQFIAEQVRKFVMNSEFIDFHSGS